MSRFHRRPRNQPGSQITPNLKNLFELIRDEKMVVEHLAMSWIISYKDNDSEAYLSLVLFLLESMGYDKSLVTSHDLESQDMEPVLAKIHKKSKDLEDYPLMSKTKIHKSFYLNFQHFWIYLATEAGEALFDDSLLTFLMNWLSSFSFSSYRSMRHTAILALLSLGQALVDILSKETNDFNRVQTFIRTEMQNSDTQRLIHLQNQEKDLAVRIGMLNKILSEMYMEVFRFRAVDIVMEIRALCVQGLHYMTEKFADKFISAGVLDIIGYGIYDKAPEVRLKSLEFAFGILGEENTPQLAQFFEKNKLRIVEMSHDIDNKCSVSAINLCTKMARFFPLEHDEKQMVVCLVWAENEEIRNAACNLLLQVVFKDKLPVDINASIGTGIDQGNPFDSEKAIMKLVNFHKDFKETELCRIEIIVQTLWNKTSAVKSWEAMCDLLKRGERSNTASLSDIDKKLIVYMLISGLKFICSSSDKKQKHIMISLTASLMQQLPGLLIFYSMDFETLKELLKIPIYLDLSAFSSKDLKDSFQSLVKVLVDLHDKSGNQEIIFRATQSLAKLAREPHALQKEARAELVNLNSQICTHLEDSLRLFALEGAEVQLEKWLLRAESVITVYDVLDDIGTETFHDIIGVLTQYLSNGTNNSTIASSAAGIMYFYHLWDLNKITKSPEGLEKYCETRNAIIENFTAIVAKPDCNPQVKYRTFKYLCESLMVISSQAAFGSPLHYEVNKDVWTTIEEYVISVPINKTKPGVPSPANCFYKYGAKEEPTKEDADEISQTLCLLIARIISFCPSITTSHLPSSFFAHFGVCPLKSIILIVKQVITHYKTKESQQSGVFSDGNLFFSIVLESLIKCMGTGSEEDIENMKDLAKKFIAVLGTGAMRPKQADKLLSFVLDGISFAFSDKDNFQILEGIAVFLTKSYLSPTQMKELYDRISIDADAIEKKIKEHETDIVNIMYPIKHFLYSIGKIVGVARQPPVLPSEKTKKQISKRREELYKKKDPEEKSKIAETKPVAVKKSSFNLIEEFKSSSKKTNINDDDIYLPQEHSDNENSEKQETKKNRNDEKATRPGLNSDDGSKASSNEAFPSLPSKRQRSKEVLSIPLPKQAIKKSSISEALLNESLTSNGGTDMPRASVKKTQTQTQEIIQGVKPAIKKASIIFQDFITDSISEPNFSDEENIGSMSEEFPSDSIPSLVKPSKVLYVKKY